jgi:GT2 family glycosyltransferase
MMEDSELHPESSCQTMQAGAPETLISVIIVSWNAKAYLDRCLQTLHEHAPGYPMEVLVVDNDSSDGSPEMVAEKYPQVRLIPTGANLGFAKANNVGLRQSRGRYLALINSDVEVLADCIHRLVEYCEGRPEVGMVGPRVIGADGKLQRSCRGFPTVWNMFCRAFALDAIFPKRPWFTGYLLQHWSQECEREVDILSGCFWLARRQAVEQVGLLDESFFMYGEDMDWCKRFWLGGWKLVFVPSAQSIHYGGASSSNAPVRFYIEKQRADLQYWRKHHRWFAQQCYFMVSCLQHLLRITGYAVGLLFPAKDRKLKRMKVLRSIRCLHWLLLPTNISRVVWPWRLSGSMGSHPSAPSTQRNA